MLPDQSFATQSAVQVLLSVRKASGREIHGLPCLPKKMSFIHLFLQYIECLSYMAYETRLLICFPRHKSLRNLTTIRRKS